MLAPYSDPEDLPDTWSDFVEGFVGRRLAVHSPAMLAAIGRLNLQVVWCTTWGEQAELAFGPLLGDGPRRTLDLAGLPLAEAGAKGAAVAADLVAVPGPFVWIDDDAITARARDDLAALELPALLITPDRRIGLEPDHLRTIAGFVERLGRLANGDGAEMTDRTSKIRRGARP